MEEIEEAETFNPLAKTEEDDKFTLFTEIVNRIESFVPYMKEANMELGMAFSPENVPIYTHMYEEGLTRQKQYLIDFLIEYMQAGYPSLTFNENMIKKFANHLVPFDAYKLQKFIHTTYADVDLETVRQLQALIVSEMVGSYNHKTIDDIEDINSAGIQLHASDYHDERSPLVNAVVKFSQIVIGDIPPTETIGFGDIEEGTKYSTNHIKSLRVFKNNAVKVIFNSVTDRARFKATLYREPWAVLFRPEPVVAPTEPLDICAACMVKDYMCETCMDYSNWAGNCSYCIGNNNKNFSSECGQCSSGRIEKMHIVNIKRIPEFDTFLDNKSRERR